MALISMPFPHHTYTVATCGTHTTLPDQAPDTTQPTHVAANYGAHQVSHATPATQTQNFIRHRPSTPATQTQKDKTGHQTTS